VPELFLNFLFFWDVYWFSLINIQPRKPAAPVHPAALQPVKDGGFRPFFN
jgi:hypothetical protein